jgi:hypothetical protein
MEKRRFLFQSKSVFIGVHLWLVLLLALQSVPIGAPSVG